MTPTNKACRNINKDAVTIHRLLGSSMNDPKGLEKKLQNLDYIFVDEVSMVKEVFYSIFSTMKSIKPSLKFIIAGDARQLSSVCDRVNFDYINSRILFELCDGNRLLLSKCRRSGDKLFNVSLAVDGLDVFSYPKTNEDLSICFTNKKRITINNHWMKIKAPVDAPRVNKLSYDPNSQDMWLYTGLPLIARVNNKQHDIANNETFTVFHIDDKQIKVKDGDIEKLFLFMKLLSSLIRPIVSRRTKLKARQ